MALWVAMPRGFIALGWLFAGLGGGSVAGEGREGPVERRCSGLGHDSGARAHSTRVAGGPRGPRGARGRHSVHLVLERTVTSVHRPWQGFGWLVSANFSRSGVEAKLCMLKLLKLLKLPQDRSSRAFAARNPTNM